MRFGVGWEGLGKRLWAFDGLLSSIVNKGHILNLLL
jgi:hypothetical protein